MPCCLRLHHISRVMHVMRAIREKCLLLLLLVLEATLFPRYILHRLSNLLSPPAVFSSESRFAWYAPTMTSLKRARPADGSVGNLSSKVYVRTTRNGKVQKIVRELYLRQDIPCSSKLCSICLKDAPTNYNNKRKYIALSVHATLITLTSHSSTIRIIRQTDWHEVIPEWPLSGP